MGWGDASLPAPSVTAGTVKYTQLPHGIALSLQPARQKRPKTFHARALVSIFISDWDSRYSKIRRQLFPSSAGLDKSYPLHVSSLSFLLGGGGGVGGKQCSLAGDNANLSVSLSQIPVSGRFQNI